MTSKTALLVIDVQNDFCPGGGLAVEGGDEIVPVVNRLIGEHEHVILTQDWHPAGHSSFASSHEGKSPFDTIEMAYGPQTLWPDHCIQGTKGAEFHADLDWTKAELVIRKGFRPAIDSYSGFLENDKQTPTGLYGYLHERGFDAVTVCGLAFDYCVAFTAIDAAKLGLKVRVESGASRAITDTSSKKAMEAFAEAGIDVA